MRSQALYRVWTLIAIGGPVVILTVSFVAIAVYTGHPWPWFDIVHESGDRTLLGTIFFFEHTARELPLDLILGAAVGSSVLFALPLGRTDEGSAPKDRRWILAASLALVTAAIVGGTLWVGGVSLLYENLIQFPTRPSAPPEWGGHWRYHFLSHVMLMSVALGMGALLAIAVDGTAASGNRVGWRNFQATAALFAVLTIVFGLNLDPFVDPVVIGHQLRESLTHAVVTVPAAFGVSLFLGKPQWRAPGIGTVAMRGALIAGVFGVAVGCFLLISGVVRSSASQGQSESLAVLLFPHFFEHTFSYVVASLAAGLVVECARTR